MAKKLIGLILLTLSFFCHGQNIIVVDSAEIYNKDFSYESTDDLIIVKKSILSELKNKLDNQNELLALKDTRVNQLELYNKEMKSTYDEIILQLNLKYKFENEFRLNIQDENLSLNKKNKIITNAFTVSISIGIVGVGTGILFGILYYSRQ